MNRTLWVILVGACLIAPFFVYPVFLAKLLCFGLFACAFNLLIGYTGLLSFGHAAFFGSAAYVCGYLARDVGLTPELAILSGGLAAGGIGYIFGALAIRRQGIYFAMITLALAQIVFFIALKAPITGGEDGLQGVPRGNALGLIDLNDTMAMYYFVMTVFLAGFWLIARIVDSPFGQVLKAIRENEPRALSLGFNVARYKHMAFVLSAALAGVAGATKTIVFQFASLPDASWHLSRRGGTDDAVGRAGNHSRPHGGRLHRSDASIRAQRVWFLGDGCNRPDFHCLRAALPAGHRGRIRTPLPQALQFGDNRTGAGGSFGTQNGNSIANNYPGASFRAGAGNWQWKGQ